MGRKDSGVVALCESAEWGGGKGDLIVLCVMNGHSLFGVSMRINSKERNILLVVELVFNCMLHWTKMGPPAPGLSAVPRTVPGMIRHLYY